MKVNGKERERVGEDGEGVRGRRDTKSIIRISFHFLYLFP